MALSDSNFTIISRALGTFARSLATLTSLAESSESDENSQNSQTLVRPLVGLTRALDENGQSSQREWPELLQYLTRTARALSDDFIMQELSASKQNPGVHSFLERGISRATVKIRRYLDTQVRSCKRIFTTSCKPSNIYVALITSGIEKKAMRPLERK